MFRIVIPARYGSTRLPGKPLRLLAGRPLIEHVHARASAAGAREVIVATDDERIAAACRGFGAEVELTDARHASGTDRLAEVARLRGWAGSEIVVNVQGDEPLLAPANIAQAAALLAADPEAAIATLATPIRERAELADPDVVKVVADLHGRALYFSRAPIPHLREARALSPRETAWRHIGLYAYRVEALALFAALPQGRLERLEQLEQLRALEHGLKIAVALAEQAPGPGVDTEADLEAVEQLLTTVPPAAR